MLTTFVLADEYRKQSLIGHQMKHLFIVYFDGQYDETTFRDRPEESYKSFIFGDRTSVEHLMPHNGPRFLIQNDNVNPSSSVTFVFILHDLIRNWKSFKLCSESGSPFLAHHDATDANWSTWLARDNLKGD